MKSLIDLDRAVAAVERVSASAATAEELFAAMSSEMHRLVPHDGAMWFGVDPATLLATAPSRVEAVDPGLCSTFWHLEFHEQDVGRFVDLARGEEASAMRLALDDVVGRSPRYREFLQPQGYTDELRGVFRSGGSVWGMVALYREGSPFARDDVALLKKISCPVAEALRLHVRHSSPWLGQPAAPGLMIVDREGRIVSANQEAMAWLRFIWPSVVEIDATDPERPDSSVLRSRKLDALTPLHALVSRARAVHADRERGPARLRLRDCRGHWVVLHASALSGPEGQSTDWVAITIDVANSAEIAPIVIDSYALTSRERDVLGLIAKGSATAEIAAQLFLSPHTVRDHIKTVFEKVGVSSRGELVARLFGDHYADPLHETMVHVD